MSFFCSACRAVYDLRMITANIKLIREENVQQVGAHDKSLSKNEVLKSLIINH
jgi:hypothetical protein